MKIFLTAVLALLSLSNVACAQSRTLSTGVNEFCWKFFDTLNINDNTVFSPYGIHAALSMLANGATGETQAEILRVLNFDDVDALNGAHKNFYATTEANYRDENIFRSTNLLPVNKKAAERGLNENFRRVVTDDYNSDVRILDFSGNINRERQKLARFVAEKTSGMIRDYQPIVDENTQAELFNVVYFKGAWQFPFDERGTETVDFTNYDGTKSQIFMMSATFNEKIPYFADEKFCGIKLPYTSGAAMFVIMPVDEKSLYATELWSDETVEYRENFLDALNRSPAFDGKVSVRLPKIMFDHENFIVQNLMALGMKKSFTGDAQFPNIVNGMQLKVGGANHRAAIVVGEQGTEAAAVTEIPMLIDIASPEPPEVVYFHANRPYVFVIRDVASSMTLFVGAVNKFF
ncbi:MAG: hypothetical protein IJ774_12990 [Selenomonadaceae bacterium]|nr:hypothetical protein [Selenomonadaceae bacterium]